MTLIEKIKTIDNKISGLAFENVGKYECLTGKDVLPEKDLLGKLLQLKVFNICH